MRTYHIFIIKNEYYNVYQKNPFSLYKTLENLYKMDIHEYSFAASLYMQICQMHNVEVLHTYLKHAAHEQRKNSYLLIHKKSHEKTVVSVRPSVLVIRTNKNIPHLFFLLRYYHSYLFVCDFKNKDYFWLSNQYPRKIF